MIVLIKDKLLRMLRPSFECLLNKPSRYPDTSPHKDSSAPGPILCEFADFSELNKESGAVQGSTNTRLGLHEAVPQQQTTVRQPETNGATIANPWSEPGRMQSALTSCRIPKPLNVTCSPSAAQHSHWPLRASKKKPTLDARARGSPHSRYSQNDH